MGMLQQLMQMLQSLMGNGCNGPYASSQCPPDGNERYFRNATASSDGDPHLSFNGEHWDNMKSHPNLLHSDSIAGGYRVSTQVTPANGKGATWNQTASVALNGGATTVSLNNKGEAEITSNGHNLSIARGQTLQLGNGESVSCEQNGSLCITAENGSGGRITTTLSAQGRGVDVDVSAQNVDLGGALVNGYERHGPKPENPIQGPIPVDPISGGPIEFEPDA